MEILRHCMSCPRAKPHRSGAIPYSKVWASSLAKCSWSGTAGTEGWGTPRLVQNSSVSLSRQHDPSLLKDIWEWWQGSLPHPGPCQVHSTPKLSAEATLGPTFSCAGASLKPCSQVNCCAVKLHGIKRRGIAWVQSLSSGSPSPVEKDGT